MTLKDFHEAAGKVCACGCLCLYFGLFGTCIALVDSKPMRRPVAAAIICACILIIFTFEISRHWHGSSDNMQEITARLVGPYPPPPLGPIAYVTTVLGNLAFLSLVILGWAAAKLIQSLSK